MCFAISIPLAGATATVAAPVGRRALAGKEKRKHEAKSNGPEKLNRDVKFHYNLPGALTATGRLGGTTLAAGLNL